MKIAEVKAYVGLVSAWGDINKMLGSWGVSFPLSLWVEFSYYLLGCMFVLLLLYRMLSCDPATLLPSSPSLSPHLHPTHPHSHPTFTQLTLTFTQFTLTFTQFTPAFTPHFHPAHPQFPQLTLTQFTFTFTPLSPSSSHFHPVRPHFHPAQPHPVHPDLHTPLSSSSPSVSSAHPHPAHLTFT